MGYTLKTTNTYRVPTVEDALALRKYLEKTCIGELTAFKYTTKYIKVKGEIVEEYQVVTATFSIDNEKEILHDSEMEIEIRANMLYVIELIKDKLKQKNILINAVELDNLIWWMGKKNKDRKSIAHHTITIFY